MKKHIVCCALALMTTLVEAQTPIQLVAFEHVFVVSMDSSELLRDQTVLIAKDRIVRVGNSLTASIPKGAYRIDGHGKYLMPGLADMHVHLQSPIELQLFLAYGVTILSSRSVSFDLARDEVRSGKSSASFA